MKKKNNYNLINKKEMRIVANKSEFSKIIVCPKVCQANYQ